MNVFEKRQMWLDLAGPNVSEETVKKYVEMLSQERSIMDNYGERKELQKDKVEGRRVESEYCGERNAYWVPSDAVWANGLGIKIDRADRIFEEDASRMIVGGVQDSPEVESIKRSYIEDVQAHLKRRGVIK